ncbi:reverse transcriptase [Gigaspora margarita]|uniref:Reverse transcriptase n=1 Tax=Gigaspora margarita TaxID=4874 RepID=A0A8H4AAH2_GIGMA|nr:reverse transcriptase [Gigaspora margarita]
MNGLSSLLDFHKISNPTWQGRGLYSQIDDIWVSSNILLDIDTPDITDATSISNSDHMIISTSWHTRFTPIVPCNKKRKHQKDIKKATRNHFNKWSKKNLPNEDYQKEWEEHYAPIKKIDSRIYEQLMIPFDSKELLNIISEVPAHKALEPTGPLTYELCSPSISINYDTNFTIYIDNRTCPYMQEETLVTSANMLKAFNSIHIPTLLKALERIKIPTSFINLIDFILSNHTNRVLTDFGPTNTYLVEDGIDQGETFSPIL